MISYDLPQTPAIKIIKKDILTISTGMYSEYVAL